MVTNTKEKQLVSVRFLGGFSLSADGNEISDKQNQMNKLWNILAYIIYNRDRMVRQGEFIEHFWGKEQGNAPLNALKTQLFRIRKILQPLFGDTVKPILSYRGGYQWNPSLETHSDIDEFEEINARIVRPDTSAAKREALLQEAIALYRGDFLPKLSHQAWVREAANRSRLKYLKLMDDYVHILEKRGAHDTMVSVLQRAAAIYPLEESLHTGIVRGLLHQERHIQALAHYEQATDLLYRSLGIQPWKELRELYDRIMATEQLFEADLAVIQQDLGETVKKEGAFFCEYGSFREIYRLEARRSARSDADTNIVLLTVQNADGSIPEPRVMEKAIEKLKEAIVRSLRSGDVFTRYSSGQFLIMLPETSPDDAELVVERICGKLWRSRNPKLKVSARVRKLNLTPKSRR